MKPTSLMHALALAGALSLAGCGGGGGGGTAAPAPAPAPAPTPTVTFAEVSVHDPAVIQVDGTYYVFGSHLAAAKSTDLMNWTKIADGVNDSNPLFNKVTTELAEAFAWSTVTDLWAPDVARLDDGKFYFYYNSAKGTDSTSALGVAVADKVDGPYVNKQIFLKSGMWGQISPDGTVYDPTKHPNTVDPNVFKDATGKLWMIYGSYSGGIFIMAMDKSTGLPVAGQGYGKHLMGGNHARIEGPYVLYSPQTQYYYLFTSWGGLTADGGYNLRVARSKNPDGPYLDAKGTDMATVMGKVGTIFDDASIAPYGQKLVGNFQFALAAGETGTQYGYVSPGHNSAFYDAATGKYFIVLHTRFPGQGEFHQVRVHELFINADGWPVMAPERYVPLSKSPTTLSADVSAADAAGSYQLVNHGKDISATIKQAQNIKLGADGSVSGAVSGTWTYDGGNNLSLVLGSTGTFKGVLSRQWNTNANAFVVTFTAQSVDGVSLWGLRTGN
jgi:arabinan endo-1,5-alpha-L-arabinosidase